MKLVMGSRTIIASKSGCYLVSKLCQTLLWPHEPGWPTRLLCPWDSPGKNTGAGCRFRLLGVFLTQGLNQSLLNWRRILYHCVTYCEVNQMTDGAWKASSSESQRPEDWKPAECFILSEFALVLGLTVSKKHCKSFHRPINEWTSVYINSSKINSRFWILIFTHS